MIRTLLNTLSTCMKTDEPNCNPVVDPHPTKAQTRSLLRLHNHQHPALLFFFPDAHFAARETENLRCPSGKIHYRHQIQLSVILAQMTRTKLTILQIQTAT